MGRGNVTGRRGRRRATIGVVALALVGAVAAGDPASAAPAALAAPVVPAAPPASAASVAPAALPPVPVPPVPGSMRWRGEKAMERFDGKGRSAPDEVTAWGVDEASGKLVVDVVGTPSTAARRFTADSDPAAVAVRPNVEPVRPFGGNLIGGQAIFGGGVRCSVGFSIVNRAGVFVLTAGHCTDEGTPWSGVNGTRIGGVAASSFPGDDFGAIYREPSSRWVPTARVQGGPTVRGSVVARIGAQVCRSGSTTGYRCGVVQAYDQTVNYGGGDVVTGLTRTNACAQGGDSGGSFVTPAGQAQGLTSGGSGDCTSGGTTYFQPLGEVLQRYRARLVTG